MIDNRSYHWTRAAGLGVIALLVGCAPAPKRPEGQLTLDGAATHMVADFAHQLGFFLGKKTYVIDPMIDGRTGQQTQGSVQGEKAFDIALSKKLPAMERLPFNEEGIARSKLAISGVLTPQEPRGNFLWSVAVTDRKSGLVVAQSAAVVTDANLSTTPTAFYQKSPSTVRDRSIEGYVKTSSTPKGQPADALYLQQLPTAALISSALEAYNAQKWEDALAAYEEAATRPDGQQLRTFNGIYLCNVELGRLPQAEEAFAKIVAIGLATNNLAVKILFQPGSTAFWADPSISGLYPMWIRQIAKGAKDGGGCLQVTGHTSPTGSESFNSRLSLERAEAIRRALSKHAPSIERTTRVQGVGSQANIVGTGTDDASDALDRRVEFKMLACQ